MLPTDFSPTRDARSNWKADHHPRSRARKTYNLRHQAVKRWDARDAKRADQATTRDQGFDVAESLGVTHNKKRKMGSRSRGDDDSDASSDRSYDCRASGSDSGVQGYSRSRNDVPSVEQLTVSRPLAGELALEAAIDKALAVHEEKMDKEEYDMLNEKKQRRQRVSRLHSRPETSRSVSRSATAHLEGEDDYEMVEVERAGGST